VRLRGQRIRRVRHVPEEPAKPCGDTFEKFARDLRDRRIFAELLYELRPDDAPDFILDVDFACMIDLHRLANIPLELISIGLLGLPLLDADYTVESS